MADETHDTLTPTARTTLKRQPGKGSYDRKLIYSILDEALISHIGFIDDGVPFVLPTNHVRIGDRLCFHSAIAARRRVCLLGGSPACVTVTLVDGLVLARSALHHSMNFRSVVILGQVSEVTDTQEKTRILEALVDHVVPGRSGEVRSPSVKEARATAVLSIPINEASAKVRTGPPNEEERDYALPVWAGVIPTALTAGTPVPDPKLAPGIDPPAYVTHYQRPSPSSTSQS